MAFAHSDSWASPDEEDPPFDRLAEEREIGRRAATDGWPGEKCDAQEPGPAWTSGTSTQEILSKVGEHGTVPVVMNDRLKVAGKHYPISARQTNLLS